MALIRAQRGMVSKLNRELGLSNAAVSQWDEVPAERLADVSRISGIPAADLRPDLAALFASEPLPTGAPV